MTNPYLDERGTLIIPTDSDPKYHHWKGGQSVVMTLKEINAPLDVLRQFVNDAEFEKLKAQSEKLHAQSA